MSSTMVGREVLDVPFWVVRVGVSVVLLELPLWEEVSFFFNLFTILIPAPVPAGGLLPFGRPSL